MNRSASSLSVAVSVVCLAIVSFQGAPAADPSATASQFGHHQTAWQPWPGEVRLDQVFPQSIGAEALPAPPGQALPPVPRAPEGLVPEPALPFLPEVPTPATKPLPGETPAVLPPSPFHDVPGLPLPAEPAGPLPNSAPLLKGKPAEPTPPTKASASPANSTPVAPKPLSLEPPVSVVSPTVAADAVPNPETSGLLTVYVPYDAKVFINGLETRSPGSRRTYVCFGLKPGLAYKFEIRAQVARDGRPLEETHTLIATAGSRMAAAFAFSREPELDVPAEPFPTPTPGMRLPEIPAQPMPPGGILPPGLEEPEEPALPSKLPAEPLPERRPQAPAEPIRGLLPGLPPLPE